MLFSSDTKEINGLKNKIINLYKEAWDIGGSYKHARTEIEHIEFVQAIWRDSSSKKKIVKALGEVKEALEGLMG